MVTRGKKPSCTACRVSENAPEMSACDAMIVATVESEDHRIDEERRDEREERVLRRLRVLDEARRLPEVVEQQGGHDEREPGEADGVAAEVAHVGIERLAAGDDEDDAAEDEERLATGGPRRSETA